MSAAAAVVDNDGSSTNSTSSTSTIDSDNIFDDTSGNNNDNANTPESETETITTSNIDDTDMVESLYNNEMPKELIGYSCKQVLKQNTVEIMDLIFYMDVLSPIIKNTSYEQNEQTENELDTIQAIILEEISIKYQIDPNISKGLRCFDLPVDGSTWIVEIYFDSSSTSNDFNEISLFGGCRELEWDAEIQNCRFYEVHLHGSYIGAVAKDENGTPFDDVIGELESLIDGPKLVKALETELNNDGSTTNANANANANYYYDTAFIGVPRAVDDPNFQGGIDEQYGRDELVDPVNIKTSIGSSESAAQAPGNRKTITVVGGLLVGCFSIAFILIGYVLYQRQRSYSSSRRRNNDNDNDNCGRRNRQDTVRTTDLAVHTGTGSSPEDDDDDIDNNDEFDDDGANAFARHYNLDQGDEDGNDATDEQSGDHDEQNYGGQNNIEGGRNNNNNSNNNEIFQDDEPDGMMMMMQQQQQQQQHNLPQEEEYPDLPMSTEAIRMDLGNSLKGQLMGLHGSTNNITTNNNNNTSGGPYGDGMPSNIIGGGSTGTGTTSDKRGTIGSGGSHYYHHHQNVPDGGGGNGGLFNMDSTQPTSVDGNESDEVDSWAQTDGTIGSLDLQLEPITAEV